MSSGSTATMVEGDDRVTTPLTLPVGLSMGHATQPFSVSVELAEQVEAAGLDFVSVGDSGCEVFSMLGAIAARTSRLGLQSGVAVWSRTPVAMAHAAKTVHNLSDGRFLLGIGPMPRTWATQWHDLAYDPVVGRMREYLTAVRAALDATAESPVTIEGKYFSLDAYPGHPVTPERRVPLAMAATLPAMTKLAAELTDAVMLNTIQPWEWLVGPGREQIAEGLDRSGRTRDQLELGIMRFCAVDEDRAAAYDRVRRSISFYFQIPYFRPLLEPWGFGAELDAGEAAYARGDKDGMAAAVSDRMVDSIGVAGTPSEVVARLQQYSEHVDWVQVSSSLNLSGDVTRTSTQRLIEVLGSARAAARSTSAV